MREPDAFSASDIAKWTVSEEYESGKWRPARTCGIDRSIFSLRRFGLAWRVFTGRYDALYWEDKRGEKSNSEIVHRNVYDKLDQILKEANE